MELRRAASWQELRAGFRWQVPARYNIARECCGRWAADRSRFALYYEDEAGRTEAWTFWDVQRAADRLANVLAAMGVMRGDRVAILLPQRPQTGIAHIACCQMGAIAVPLPHLLGSEGIARRLADAGARVAIVDPATLEKLAPARERLPELRHVIGVAGARESWVREWDRLLPLASPRYAPVDTAAAAPALIAYAAGATDDHPPGALMAQHTLLGSLSGFVCAHDFYPQPGDMFWSTADWALSDGLFGALLPAWNFGQPILGYRGRFDPEKACWLIEKYGVRNASLSPAELKLMMEALPQPQAKHDLGLRSIAAGGGAAGEAVCAWAREQLGVAVNATFGQAEINCVVGGCGAVYAPRPGAMGRPYPGHEVAVLDETGNPLPAGETGEICVRRSCRGEADPALFLEYWRNPQATREKFFGSGDGAWGRTGDLAKMDGDGYLWHQGRAGDASRGAGYRIRPDEEGRQRKP